MMRGWLGYLGQDIPIETSDLPDQIPYVMTTDPSTGITTLPDGTQIQGSLPPQPAPIISLPTTPIPSQTVPVVPGGYVLDTNPATGEQVYVPTGESAANPTNIVAPPANTVNVPQLLTQAAAAALAPGAAPRVASTPTASPLTFFEASNLIPGIPNFGVIGGLLAVLLVLPAILGGGGGKRRR